MPAAQAASRILIIDDEAAIRESLETLLTLEGFHVDQRAGWRTRACASSDDRNLRPGAARSCAARPKRNGDSGVAFASASRNLPVIMITAYGTVQNVVDAMRAGAKNFVQKPWDNEKLLADIRCRHRAASRGRRKCPAEARAEAALQL